MWQEHLENEPERWMIRHLPDDQFWMNKASRELHDITEAIIPYKAAIQCLTPDSVRPVEDRQSLAMKTQVQQEITYKNRPRHVLCKTHAVLVPYHCERCPKRCGLILFLARDLGGILHAPALSVLFLSLLSLVLA